MIQAARGLLALAAATLTVLVSVPGAGRAAERLGGTVRVDGSSTVFPITEAVAEEFQAAHPGARVTVGISGTGGGFKKFCAGETDISDASRPIKKVEQRACSTNGVEYVELPVAFDGLSVVVNPGNDFVDSLTVEELRRIWQPASSVRLWSDIRPAWPDRQVHLYGPGTASGTFDYFTKAIVGREGASRPDFTASEDDNVLVHGIAGDRDGLGFFGYAYYAENADKLRLVAIDAGKGPVLPSVQTINHGSYQPLSRPLLIYVARAGAKRPVVNAFARFYIEQAATLVPEVGYVALPASAYKYALERLAARRTGSVFGGSGSKVGVGMKTLLRRGQ